ncbi:MAG: hypothetical protein F4W92_08780 [Gammaproteobacteria bacterium]|nr:hypothetical protein [Gammaproteobacteria bacterium]
MIEPILGILLIFMFAPSNEVENDLVVESNLSPEPVELEASQDEQSEEDCRYKDESIPHRDLSDYVIVEEISVNMNEEMDVAQSDATEQPDSEQFEDVHNEPERAEPHGEEKE